MTNRVVLDMSVLVALVDTRDKWHSAATVIKDALKAGVVYLDPVINGTISFQDIASFDGGFDLIAWIHRLGKPDDVGFLALR